MTKQPTPRDLLDSYPFLFPGDTLECSEDGEVLGVNRGGDFIPIGRPPVEKDVPFYAKIKLIRGMEDQHPLLTLGRLCWVYVENRNMRVTHFQSDGAWIAIGKP